MIEPAALPGRTLETLELAPGLARLGPNFIARVTTEPLADPHLLDVDAEVAALLDLDPEEFRRPEFLKLASGAAHFRGLAPFAAVYAGHQFGSYVARLGDGRAITLAEVVAANGERYEWQLKGAGRTPFSRFADGRAVLRSTIREYLASETMAHLGIATTRALAIAAGSDTVYREQPETAAILTRIAPSFVRFGSFEFFHYAGKFAEVKTLADDTIARHFPHLGTIAGERERYAAFLRDVVVRTADLVAAWQAAGFAHGVLNTDNMSILGITLDYGPYGFMEAFEPGFICNHTDEGGRYAFDRQPAIGLWNCHALAAALGTLVDDAGARDALAAYEPAFRAGYLARMRAKFGFANERDGDATLIDDALALLARERVDYPTFFRRLGDVGRAAAAGDGVSAPFAGRDEWPAWLARYRERLAAESATDAERRTAMHAVNPAVVLRNHLAQAAIEAAAAGDAGELKALAAALRQPFREPGEPRYCRPQDPAAERIVVSCSS